jgi:hypothetical protein
VKPGKLIEEKVRERYVPVPMAAIPTPREVILWVTKVEESSEGCY